MRCGHFTWGLGGVPPRTHEQPALESRSVIPSRAAAESTGEGSVASPAGPSDTDANRPPAPKVRPVARLLVIGLLAVFAVAYQARAIREMVRALRSPADEVRAPFRAEPGGRLIGEVRDEA